jgi:hypothetical protein
MDKAIEREIDTERPIQNVPPDEAPSNHNAVQRAVTGED